MLVSLSLLHSPSFPSFSSPLFFFHPSKSTPSHFLSPFFFLLLFSHSISYISLYYPFLLFLLHLFILHYFIILICLPFLFSHHPSLFLALSQLLSTALSLHPISSPTPSPPPPFSPSLLSYPPTPSDHPFSLSSLPSFLRTLFPPHLYTQPANSW